MPSVSSRVEPAIGHFREMGLDVCMRDIGRI